MDFSVCTTNDSTTSPEGKGSPLLHPSSLLTIGRRSDVIDCLSLIEAKCVVCTNTLIHSFIQSFVCPFIHSVIH